ncbi:MAG: exosortase system-associated protein, TIGR04073 family [Candidatus Omnitrophica bacterium]|jgi:putative exosortase-associated protein (TIGR04073 family)|nr:exosortase system-associated protein, TIGR04073 family [Candidatus Omnitrophota bacterium]
MKIKPVLIFAAILTFPLAVMAYEFQKEYPEVQTKVEYSKKAIDPDAGNVYKTPFNKMYRGLINISTSWVEIPAECFKVGSEKNPVLGVTLGAMQGCVLAVCRIVTGAFDAVTFVIPPYDKPIMKPEFALQRADQKYCEYFDLYDGQPKPESQK